MITTRNIISNIAKGQSSAGLKYVLMGLNQYYSSIQRGIETNFAKEENNGTTIFLRVPSESKPNLKYDVVIWVNTENKITLDTYVKVYSNSPEFAYNFAYVFYQEGSLLFPEKYPNDFKTMPPRVRNPYQLYGFSKIVFAGLKHIQSSNLVTLKRDHLQTREPIVKTFIEKQNEITSMSISNKRRA